MKNLKTVGASEKAPNYSNDAVKEILARIPFNYDVAIELGKQLNKGAKSIVAKVKRLEADESVVVKDDDKNVIEVYYFAKDAYTPKTGNPVEKKSEIVQTIATLLNQPNDALKGLDKAPKMPLENLRSAIIALAPEASEPEAEPVETQEATSD